MYKLSELYNTSESLDDASESQFIRLLTQKWDDIHKNTDAFRYKINDLQEKMVDKMYLLQLNPLRSSNRRQPEQIENICQLFDKNKFNFTKASPAEILFRIIDENEIHVLLVNVSPISRYHSLLCPSIDKCLPQVASKESLLLCIKIMFLSQNCDLRIGFNSLCALASVNHLHYHIFLEKTTLPIESAKCTHLHKDIYVTTNYPVPAFCFEVPENAMEHLSNAIYDLVQYLLKRKIAHNIFMTRGHSLRAESVQKALRVLVWPRRSSAGAKQLAAFNVAVCELSGWFPIYSTGDFETLCRENLENELKKWRLEHFVEICDEIKQIM